MKRAKPAAPKKKKCYHCDQRLTPTQRKSHDCWTTTEEALTQNLSRELYDAWEKLRDVAAGFGGQRIYASHRSIMFSRKSCYFFVRPTKRRLELCFFVDKKLKHASIRKAYPTTKTKFAHMVFVVHADQIEEPLTDWLQAAYEFCPPEKTESRPKKKAAGPKKRKIISFEELTKR